MGIIVIIFGLEQTIKWLLTISGPGIAIFGLVAPDMNIFGSYLKLKGLQLKLCSE